MTETIPKSPDKEECSHPNPVQSMGSWVCPDCAEVLDPIYSRDPPYRMESPIFHEIFPPATVGYRTTFKQINSKFRRLHRQTKQITSTVERSLMTAINKLSVITQSLKLNISRDMRNDVINLFHTLRKKGLTKRSTIDSTLAALLFIVIHQRKIPFSLKELAHSLQMKQMRIRRLSDKLATILNITIPPIKLEDVTERLLGMLGADAETSVEVFDCINKIDIGDFSGVDLKGIAAAIVYLVSSHQGKGITQKMIAEITKASIGKEWVSEITLRTNIKRLFARRYMKEYENPKTIIN